MNFDEPHDRAWRDLREAAARRLPPTFAGAVVREAGQRRALRAQCLVALATGVLLFGGIGVGQWVRQADARQQNAQLWLQYQNARNELLGTL